MNAKPREFILSSLSPSVLTHLIPEETLDLDTRMGKSRPGHLVEASGRLQTLTDLFVRPALPSTASALESRTDPAPDLPGFIPGDEEELRGLDGVTWPLGWSAEQVLGVAAVAVIVPFILVSNLLVVVSVVRFKRLQLPTNLLVVSLAGVDIFVALAAPFFIVMELLPGQVSSPVLCLSPNRILMTACGVSVLTLAAIAYDRHTALVSPLKYVSLVTPRRILLAVTAVWLYSTAIVWTPVLLGWFSSQESSSRGSSHHPCSFQLLHDKAHVLFLGAIFGPACLAITVCYFRIYILARQHARAIAAVENSVHHNSLRVRFMIRDAKYAKTLALVIGVFLLLWTPYLACLLAEVISDVHISPWLWNYLTLLAVLNSGLNPWIYAFKNNDFRTAFRRVLKVCCCFCCSLGCSRRYCYYKIFKKWQRSNSLSGVNIFTTTTTSSNQSRSSHGFPTTSGRLSDVSCVINVGVENVDKVLDANRRRSVVSSSSTTNPASRAEDAIVRSIAEHTERRVSTLLNTDSRSFIEHLVSLHVHHSIVHRQVVFDNERDDSEVNNCSDSVPSDLRRNREVQHSEKSCEQYSHPPTDPAGDCQSDPAEGIYHEDLIYRSDPPLHSDVADDASHSDHAYHSDHTDDTYHSDHTHETDSDHLDHGERLSLPTKDVCYNSGDTNRLDNSISPFPDKPRDRNHCTDRTNHGCSGGEVKVVVHEDDMSSSLESVYHMNDVQQYCCAGVTLHSPFTDNMDKGYHSDHSDCVEMDCLTASLRS